jgi:hypothetical protein
VVVSWRDLYLTMWNGPVTVARLLPCFVASRALRAQYPDGYVAFNVIGPRTPAMVDRQARALVDDLVRENRGRPMLGEATIILATGFVAATTRAVLMGLQRLSGSAHPRAVFDTLERAADWAAPRLRPGEDGPIPPSAIVDLARRIDPGRAERRS